MKKLLYLILSLVFIISCNKDKDDNFNLTQEYLAGTWKMISFQNVSLIDGEITDFDLNQFQEYYITINDTGYATFNTPCHYCYLPSLEEVHTQTFKVINGKLNILTGKLVPSGETNPVTGWPVYIEEYFYSEVENAFDNKGRLYMRVEFYTPDPIIDPVTGKPEGQLTNIRIFEKE